MISALIAECAINIRCVARTSIRRLSKNCAYYQIRKLDKIVKFREILLFFCFTPAITGDRLARRFRRRPLLLSSTRKCLPIATERLLESLGSAALPSQGSTALTMFTMQFPCSTISPMLAANLFSPAIHKELLFINLP